MDNFSWNQISTPVSELTRGAFHQAHWAAQIPAAAGFSFAEARPDWSHTSLLGSRVNDDWVLKTENLDKAGIASVALHISELRLIALGNDEKVADVFELDGRTLEEAYAWLGEITGTSPDALTRPGHEMPDHPLAHGMAFEKNSELNEVEHHYRNMDLLLSEMIPSLESASRVRCWPHHFDIACLLKIDQDKDPEEARSIGMGLAPPDKTSNTAYIYVTPWPYPDPEVLPPLVPPAKWQKEGWVGALLSLDDLPDSGGEQLAIVLQFLDNAVSTSLGILMMRDSA